MILKNLLGFICLLIILIYNIKRLCSFEYKLYDFLESLYYYDIFLQRDEKIVKFCNRYKFIYKKNNQYHISTKGIKYFEQSKNNNYTYIYIQLTILVLSLLNFFF